MNMQRHGVWPKHVAGSPPPRAIIETPEFIVQRDALLPVAMFDRIMEGVGWVLARSPERFADRIATNLGIVRTNRFGALPEFRITYTFTDAIVRLHWIEHVDDDP